MTGTESMPERKDAITSKAKPATNKVGRPKIDFDLSVVEGLGRIGATASEMAHILPGSQSTIEHRLADRDSDFSKAYNKGRAMLNASLRRKQIELAMNGHPTMLIWLGKQLLEQADRADLRHTTVDLNDLSVDQLKALASGTPLDEVLSDHWRRQGASRDSNPRLLPGDSHSRTSSAGSASAGRILGCPEPGK